MNNLNIVRYYFIKSLTVVMESQVIGWLSNHNKLGLASNLIILKHRKSSFSTSPERLKYIRQQIGGSVLIQPILLLDYISVGVIIILHGIRIWLRERKSKRTIILQSRNLHHAFCLLMLSRLPRVKVVCEIRGTTVELVSYAKTNNILKALKHKVVIRLYSIFEKHVLAQAHAVILVSHSMKEHFIKKYPKLSLDRVYVIPGAVNEDIFFYDPETTRQEKRQNNLEGRKIIVYSGGIDLPWQIPQKIIQLFKSLHALDSSYFLLILTRTPELGTKMLREADIAFTDFKVDFVKHDKLNRYLNMADVSLLLRGNNPTNHQASPTKFAEYILAGLPCILTAWIGDYSRMSKKMQLGYVLENLAFSTEQIQNLHLWIIQYIENDYLPARQRLSETGLKLLSKSVYNSFIIEMLQQDAPMKQESIV
ncbi:MAG: glycosyltransferase [Candidatus Cloacimonetes bacterium]|nr:glycosyltransferase [Candidatus Cloacimonadota bacterium]